MVLALNQSDLRNLNGDSSSQIFIIGETSKTEQRCVAYEEASEFARANNCSYIEININQRFNCKEALQFIAQKMAKRDLQKEQTNKNKGYRCT